VAGISASGTAVAQTTLEAPKNIPVRERPRPEYDPVGIPAGSFRVFPLLSLSAAHDDNVFATDVNEVDDLIAQVEGRARIASQWSSHALNFSSGIRQELHSDFNEENATSFDLGVDGRVDIARGSSVSGSIAYADQRESRSMTTSVALLEEPVRYRSTVANLTGSTTANRLQLSGRVRLSVFDYDDGRIAGTGVVVDQDDRDRTMLEGVVRADYAISPDTGLFVDLRANSRDYDLTPPQVTVNRDSGGYEVLVGSRFELTNLMRGEVAAGYQFQSYNEPGTDDTRGGTIRANVEWFPDQLVTVAFSAARDIADAGAVGAVSYITDGVGVRADYEFRRNIILTLSTGYSFDRYQEIDRHDKRWQAALSADYMMDRDASFFASFGHVNQTSSGVDFGREFDINKFEIGVRLRR
jgi:hypothetical protein